jgi:hypothetical protein
MSGDGRSRGTLPESHGQRATPEIIPAPPLVPLYGACHDRGGVCGGQGEAQGHSCSTCPHPAEEGLSGCSERR